MSTFKVTKFLKVLTLVYIFTKEKAEFSQEELANQISLSSKQLARYFHQFEELGFCEYTAGRGRTHLCDVHWTSKVHEYLHKELLQMNSFKLLEALPKWIEELTSVDLKEQVAKFIELNVLHQLNKTNNDTLYLPMYQPITTINPLRAKDFYSVSIMSNVYNNLVTYNETGDLIGSLSISWCFEKTSIVFYLRKNVVFHNGIPLEASIVYDCFSNNKVLIEQMGIIEIKLLHENAIEIVHEGIYNEQYLLSLLAQPYAAIYLQNNDTFFGTGPYQIDHYTKDSLQLTYFPYYFGTIAMIKHVQFVRIPRSIKRKYHFSNQLQQFKTNYLYENEINLLLNPRSNYFKDELNRKRFMHIWQGDFRETFYEERQLKIGISKNKHELNLKLQNIYKDAFPNIKWVPLSFEDYIENSNWNEFDAIMITHAFSEHNPTQKLLEVIDKSGVYAIFYPEVCKDIEESIKITTNKIGIGKFYLSLISNYFIIPLVKNREEMLISNDLMLENTNLISNLSDCWKKE